MVIRPCSTPNASSSTLTIGTKQLVVQLALEITLCLLIRKSLWLTPYTNVASAFDAGADTITSGAPPSRWALAASRLLKKPVDSTTTSTPRSPHGRSAGLRSLSTLSVSPPTLMLDLVAVTFSGKRPSTESYLSRCAIVSIDPRSFTATKSMSAPLALAARKKLRPMRPKPLMPTLTVMSVVPPQAGGTTLSTLDCSSSPIRASQPPVQPRLRCTSGGTGHPKSAHKRRCGVAVRVSARGRGAQQ